MVGMIRSLQMILHLPMMLIIIPGNVSMMFEILIPFVMFDILESDYSIDLVLNFDEPKQAELAELVFDQIENLGYETHNSILNLGTVAVLLTFWLLEIVVMLLLKLYVFITGKGKKLFDYLYKRAFWGDIVPLTLETYLEFLIAGYLNM
jgi:hypothetical protein